MIGELGQEARNNQHVLEEIEPRTPERQPQAVPGDIRALRAAAIAQRQQQENILPASPHTPPMNAYPVDRNIGDMAAQRRGRAQEHRRQRRQGELPVRPGGHNRFQARMVAAGINFGNGHEQLEENVDVGSPGQDVHLIHGNYRQGAAKRTLFPANYLNEANGAPVFQMLRNI